MVEQEEEQTPRYFWWFLVYFEFDLAGEVDDADMGEHEAKKDNSTTLGPSSLFQDSYTKGGLIFILMLLSM